MKKSLIFISVLLLSGCGAISQQKTDVLLKKSRMEDWGMLDANHESRERVEILKQLKDPDSAKFRFSVERSAYQSYSDPVLAWYSWVYVNAKNLFGGYTGEQTYVFVYNCTTNQTCELIDFAKPNRFDPRELDWAK